MRQHFDYSDDETVFEGYLSIDEGIIGRRPCVLIGHAWSGPSEHFNKIADELSNQGYVAIVFDVYGKGVRGSLEGDNSHLMNPLLENRSLLRKRLLAAFKVAQEHPLVLPEKIAVLGHCFGGLCALDLARSNPKGLKGAISIHGLLSNPNLDLDPKIEASILVLHGQEDPMVKDKDVSDFSKEMTLAQADWQIHVYGHAMHAFTFAGANIPEYGIKYNEKAHRRSEKTTIDFLKEIFT